MRQCGSGILVKTIIHTAQNPHVTHRAIATYNSVKRNRSLYVAAHQLQRICRIDLLCRHRGRQLTLAFISIEFSEANDPTSSRGIQVWHVQRHGIKLPVAKDPMVNVCGLVPQNFGSGTRRRSANPRWCGIRDYAGSFSVAICCCTITHSICFSLSRDCGRGCGARYPPTSQ